MLYLLVKTTLSGVIIAIVSEVARRSPGFGALIASLPLVSLLGMIWLWRDTGDVVRMADHAEATFWSIWPQLVGQVRLRAFERVLARRAENPPSASSECMHRGAL